MKDGQFRKGYKYFFNVRITNDSESAKSVTHMGWLISTLKKDDGSLDFSATS